jgi:hypothetical protein
MKHENVEKKGKEFKELVEKFSNKYIFPYSEGHLRDLAVSNNEVYIQEDLAFLKDISNNYCLGLDNNENIVYQRNYIDIKQFFDNIKKIVKEEENNTIELNFQTDNKCNVVVNQIDENNLFKPFIENNNGMFDNKVFFDAFTMLCQNIDNPDYYKRFREQVYNIKNNFENTPNSIINQESNYFKQLLPFLNFLVDNNLENVKNNFDKTMISFLSINNERILENLTIGAKIELAYSLLDYNQNFRDKIKKKNKPNNMLRDMKHLHFASEAKYYITEDGMTYTKSKFVCEVLHLKVKILKINEFINKLS